MPPTLHYTRRDCTSYLFSLFFLRKVLSMRVMPAPASPMASMLTTKEAREEPAVAATEAMEAEAADAAIGAVCLEGLWG